MLIMHVLSFRLQMKIMAAMVTEIVKMLPQWWTYMLLATPVLVVICG